MAPGMGGMGAPLSPCLSPALPPVMCTLVLPFHCSALPCIANGCCGAWHPCVPTCRLLLPCSLSACSGLLTSLEWLFTPFPSPNPSCSQAWATSKRSAALASPPQRSSS